MHGMERVDVEIDDVARRVNAKRRLDIRLRSSCISPRSYSVPKKGVAMSYRPLTEETPRSGSAHRSRQAERHVGLVGRVALQLPDGGRSSTADIGCIRSGDR